jgi:hypothetical protein
LPANKDTIIVGSLVRLRIGALGYLMIEEPEEQLGIGLVLEYGTEEFTNTKDDMVKVLWTKVKTKRWEFLADLVLVDNT